VNGPLEDDQGADTLEGLTEATGVGHPRTLDPQRPGKPLVSVILPVYNAEEHLAEAIESVLRQTHADFELLIINDGSTDGSLEIIELYAREDPRIRVIDRANRGLIATLNEGITEARGEYIARMDADDISMPERFARQVDWLTRNAGCVLVGASFILIDESGREDRTWHCFVNDVTIRHALPAEGCIPHPTAMFRGSAVIQVGGYRDAYVAAEDYDLFRRLVHVGELHNLAEPLLYKRESERQVSATLADTQVRSADRIRNEIWQDRRLSRYKRVSLRRLCRLPGEHAPALEGLQKELALIALRHGDVRLFAYLCADIVRFRLARPTTSGTPGARARP
jgi:glycosyltransferase involved in cell wall biosynthesis